jgi:Helicase associated domain/PLD-like domain
MTINFIGHGLDISNKTDNIGNYLVSSFQDESYNKFLGFSAYATKAGMNRLIKALKVAKSNFEEIKFFLGIDDDITTKEVFQILVNLEIESFVFHINSDIIFHPKIYIFEGKRKSRIILGSSNLTKQGLFNLNIESSLVIDFSNGDNTGIKLLKQIKEYFSSILNLETENVQRIDKDSLSFFVKNGLIKSEKDRKTKNKEDDEDNLLGFFPELEKSNINDSDLGGIVTKEKENKATEREYTKNTILTKHYLETWSSNFDALKTYMKNNNNEPIPANYKDEGLIEWCRKQRFLKNEGIIPIDHEEALNSIGFYWKSLKDWLSEKSWNENFENYKNYYHKHNSYQVSKKIDKKLMSWVIHQRMEYYQGIMLDYQIQKMDDFYPNWKQTAQDKNEVKWFDKLLELQSYKQIHGNVNVPQRDSSLGRWVNDQRTQKNRGKLSEEKEEFLNSLGMIWNIGDYEFDIFLAQLIKYKKTYGNYDVELNYEDKKLANYVFRLKNIGTTEEKAKKLDEIGFNWEKHYKKTVETKSSFITKEWRKKLYSMKSLQDQGIDINKINANQNEFKEIWQWIQTQKQRYRGDELKQEQIELLVEAGLKLDKKSVYEQRWEHFYELLTWFKNENGHCKVTNSFDEEFKNWVNHQRVSYKAKTLEKSKIDKLNLLNFEWIAKK